MATEQSPGAVAVSWASENADAPQARLVPASQRQTAAAWRFAGQWRRAWCWPGW